LRWGASLGDMMSFIVPPTRGGVRSSPAAAPSSAFFARNPVPDCSQARADSKGELAQVMGIEPTVVSFDMRKEWLLKGIGCSSLKDRSWPTPACEDTWQKTIYP
jgi:hypothetical protein